MIFVAWIKSYFSDISLAILAVAILFIAWSIFLFLINKSEKVILLLLLIGACLIRIFVITLNDYLFLWDEQFHALVAKNMLRDPFKPVLYAQPVLPYDYKNWTANHIWLHKQPFFLWQIAISLKIFGIHPFVVRIPSALMSTILVWIIYRIGCILVNKSIAYYAALVYTFLNFFLELTSGYLHTDHNDIAFIFYISASIWAFLEYYQSNRKYWIYLIGLFSGIAILNKWLVGLTVYLIWGVYLLFSKKILVFRTIAHLLLSLSITLLVVLPWQVYIQIRFPTESNYEYSLNTKHIFTPVENHSGSYGYHFEIANEMYNIPFLVLCIFLFILLKKISDKPLSYAILLTISFVYVFFSVVATKMPAFTGILVVFFALSIGAGIDFFFKVLVVNKEFFRPKLAEIIRTIYHFSVLGLICLYVFNIEKIQRIHTTWQKKEDDFYMKRRNNMKIYRSHSKILNNKNSIVVGVPQWDTAILMFEYDMVAAYEHIDENAFRTLKNNYSIIAFDNGKLSHTILQDTSVVVLKDKILHY